jgi:hypothetical protein
VDRLIILGIQLHGEDGNRLRVLAEEGNVYGIEKLAHDLKSFAGNMCATEVEHLGTRTMTSARSNTPDSIEQAKVLAEAVDRLIACLKEDAPR